MTEYTNQWHDPEKPETGPAVYKTDAVAEPYRGFEIFPRLAGVWDVVQDDVCVGQFAGPDGARRDIDKHLDGTGISYLRIPEARVASHGM